MTNYSLPFTACNILLLVLAMVVTEVIMISFDKMFFCEFVMQAEKRNLHFINSLSTVTLEPRFVCAVWNSVSCLFPF